MAKLPGFRRIFSEDFDTKYKDLLDKLSGTINTGIEMLYNALNNNLTFKDNFSCTVTEVTLSVDANGTPSGGANFRLSNTLKVDGLFVISAINANNSSAYPPGAVWVSFTQSNQSVTITNVRGLTPNTQYTLKIIALN